jgi:GNAT superfamily N-acetyltransferase
MTNFEDNGIGFRISPPVTNEALNALFDLAWPNNVWSDFEPVLSRSLAYICAYHEDQPIGFVNLAWDGGIHAFLLDTTVHPDFQRRGIGRALVARAAQAARERRMAWLHVDYEPHLESFYRGCGFEPTQAGLMRLS